MKEVEKKQNREIFIERAKQIHGDKYDYSFVKYINAREPVEVFCNSCKVAWPVSPYAHAQPNLKGSGCPRCAGFLRTTEDFIREAKAVHGDKYDLSLVNYKNARDGVLIRCPKHGRTWKTTWHSFIIKRHGCAKCGKESLKKPPSFYIELFNSVHSGKYDYSLFSHFDGWHKKIKIICKKHPHNPFPQTPAAHYYLQNNCPKCAAKERGYKSRDSLSDWIKKARVVHGDLYDYSQTKYTSERDDLDILCKKHGVFSQRAGHHTDGSHCPKCFHEKQAETLTMKYRDFLERAIELHGDKYQYPDEPKDFKGSKHKLFILCSVGNHGGFHQKVSDHLRPAGCHRCNQSHGERKVRLYLSKARIEFEEQKRFEGCKDKRALPFDFFIPDLQLLIEFDGEQHYIERKEGIFAGKFSSIVRRDKIKNKFAKEAGFNLLRIKWNEPVADRISETIGALSGDKV